MPARPEQPPVRVVQLAAHDVPRRGSFVPMLRGILAAVTRRGWSAEAVLPQEAVDFDWIQDLTEDGVTVHFLPMRPRRAAAAAVRSLVASDERATILHTHFTNFDLPAVAARWSRSARTHVVWHSHDSFPSSAALRVRRRVKYALARHALAAVLFVGRESADDLRRLLGADRALHVPNAIDVKAFPLVSPAARAAARRALALPDGPVALHFGWDWERKGGDLFLQALHLLRLRGHALVGLTVGAPAQARAQGAMLELGDTVRFLPPADSVADLYAAADVFVSCSRSEGDPYAVLEAAACGLAVVASAAPGQAVGAEVPPGRRIVPLNAPAIADALDAVLARSPAEQLDEARSTRAWVEREVDVEAYARRMVHLYERVLTGGKPA
jgi:glycosyltransferase involved in cell wall biosynthesis